MITVYFDVCCLNRPFDDQNQDRIHLEAEAVLIILKHIEAHEWTWFSSEVVDFEIQQTPNPERRQEVQLLTTHAETIILLDESMILRAEALEHCGFKMYDALHLACAESASVETFLTTDDAVLKKAKRPQASLRVSVENPLEWLWRYITT